MGFYRYTSGSGTGTIPASSVFYVNRPWVSCVGGGAGGCSYSTSTGNNNDGGGYIADPNGNYGAGGGWGYAAIPISHGLNQNYNFSYTVGNGGSGSFFYAGSAAGNSSCLGVIGYAGARSGLNSPAPFYGGSYQTPSGAINPGGANGTTTNADGNQTPGAAGGAGGGPCGGRKSGYNTTDISVDQYVSPTCLTSTSMAFGGSNGNDGTGNTVIGDTGTWNGSTLRGGNGGYGGGGAPAITGFISAGGAPLINTASGNGGSGVVYVSWVDLSASTYTPLVNQPVTVYWSSPFGSGSDVVSFSSSGTQTFSKTDSKGAQSTIVFNVLAPAQITSFTANPNPQTSGSTGTPSYSTLLSWTTSGTISSLSLNQSIGNVTGSTSYSITNLPQSTAGSNSPATRTYTLTASDGYNTVTSSVTVSVYNDNTPNSFSIPALTTTGVSLSSLEPNTQYQIYIGPITGIDMTIAVIANTAGLDTSSNASTWSSVAYITNNNGVYFRFTSQPFNTNPSGLTNPRTFNFTIGSSSGSFTATTRAPNVNETFDYGNDTTQFPYPDIDVISNTPTQYTVSPTTVTVDNVEIPVPIKTNNSNVQVRIKPSGSSVYNSWQDITQI